MKYRVFLVEDDININKVICSYLRKQDWDVVSFYNGVSARQAIALHPHLWILDIMLPDIDGFQLIREIKAKDPSQPVVFTSARDADIDRIVGLEMGSDDYLAKPFLPEELVIRCRKLLQRVYEPPIHNNVAYYFLAGTYTIDENLREAKGPAGKTIDLTSKEFDLLLTFARHSGQALAREQILTAVWGVDYYGTDRVVDDLVRRLRRKLPELRLDTIYGYGYRLVKT